MADELGIKVFGDARDAEAAMVGLARTSERSFDQVERGLGNVDKAQAQAGVSTGRLNAGITGLTAGLGAMAGSAALGAAQAGLAMLKSEISASITAASDLNETLSKSEQVFGDNAAQVEEWSQSSATAFGLSQNAALGATATLGDMFNTMKLGAGPAMDMSTTLVELSADVASFHNAAGGAEEVLQAMRSGLIGESEPLRRFGVLLSEAAVQAKAAELGLGGANRELTEAEKVQARYAIILEQTASAQGDFARTADGQANQARILDAQMEDLRATLGQGMLPAVTEVTKAANDLLASPFFQGGMLKVAEEIGQVAQSTQDMRAAVDAAIGPVAELAELTGTLGPASVAASTGVETFLKTLPGIGTVLTLNDAIRDGKGLLQEFGIVAGEAGDGWSDFNIQLIENGLQAAGVDVDAFVTRVLAAAAALGGGVGSTVDAQADAAERAAEAQRLYNETVAAADARVQQYQENVTSLNREVEDGTAWNEQWHASNERIVDVMIEAREASRHATDAGHRHNQMIAESAGAYDDAAVSAGLLERHVDDLTAAHDRLRGALNPVEAALDVFRAQIEAGIPLTAEQTRQVQILGMAQQGLQQQINDVTIAQGLAAAGFNTQLTPAVGGATGLMVGAVGAAGGLYTALWTLSRQPWYVDVVIRQSVMAVGSQAGGNDEPGGFLPGTQAPLPTPPPLPSFDVDAWVADVIGDVAGGSTSSSGGGGGAAASAAEEAGVSLANQIVENLVQSVLDGERSIEDAVAFVLDHLDELGITGEDFLAGLAASWRGLQEEIALGQLAGEDVSQAVAALGVLEDAIEATTGKSIEDFAAWAAAVEAAGDTAVGAAARATKSFEAAVAAAEALAGTDPFGWLTGAQDRIDQLQAQIDLAPILGIPQEQVDKWTAERDALAAEIAQFGAGLGEALASGLIDPEMLAGLDQASRDLILTILAPFVDPAVLAQIAGAGVLDNLITADDIAALEELFKSAPEAAVGMVDDIIGAVQAGRIPLAEALELLALLPGELLGPALERLRAQLQDQLGAALLEFGADSPEVAAFREGLALVDAALGTVGETAVRVTAEGLAQLQALFAEYPELTADMLDELVAAVAAGALSFEEAMQLLADVPDATLRPALERMRDQLVVKLGQALLSLRPDSPEVQAILESLALIDAALSGLGDQAERTTRSVSRGFRSARADALTTSPAVRAAAATFSGGGFGGGSGGGASFGAGGTAGYIDPTQGVPGGSPQGGTFVAQIEIDRNNHERFIVDVNNRKMSRILG